MSGERELTGLLNKCVSLIDTKQEIGTGFFVAPGLILTCAHVVRVAADGREPVCVIYGGKKYTAKPIKTKELFIEDDKDLALLRIELKKHPCVLLGITDNLANAELHSYGFTLVKGDKGEQKTVVEEFRARFEGERKELRADLTFGAALTKFREGQVRSGYSGAPLLDIGAGLVTGVVNMTRGTGTDLGGFAVPTQTIFSLFPKLKKLNGKFHKENLEWTQLTQGIKARKPSNPISVRLYTEPRKLAYSENFVERSDLLDQVEKLLEKETARVNMNGMAGIGKTTLAYEVLDRRFDKKRGAVLWVEVGSASPEEVIDAIPEDGYQNPKLLGTAHDFRSKKETLYRFFEEEMKNEKISLVVLDNVVEGNTWLDLSNAFPRGLPILLTSRARFAAKDIVDVGQLSRAQALFMLEKTVGDEDYSNDKDAAFLCELFGYHPLAIEILGANMKEVPLGPREQRQRLEKDPARLKSELHEDRLWVLLEDSAAGLNDLERSIFHAFGEFPVNGLTLNILAIYLRQPSEELLEALDHLGKRNLGKNRPDTDFYFLHDVVFHYVKPVEKNKSSLIRVALRYLKKYRREFDLIKLDIANLLAIAKLSQQLNLVKIISYLVIGDYPLQEGKSYADQRGYSIGLIEQLDRAIEVARSCGDELKPTTHYLLGKRGNAAFQRGEYQLAAEKYTEELLLSPDDERRAVVGSILARTLVFCGRKEEARKGFETAHQLAEKLQNEELRLIVLGQESWAAGYLQDYAAAQQIAENQLILAEALYKSNNRNYERFANALMNFGSAKLYLARQAPRKMNDVLNLYERARDLAVKYQDDPLLADAIISLGEYYDYVDDKAQAQAHFSLALEMLQTLGMARDEQELVMLMNELGYFVRSSTEV